MIFPTYTIGEVCEFVLDGTHGSPARVESGIPVLSAQHVIDGKLNFETDRFTTEEEYKNYSRRFHLQKGDVLFTIVGTIGRSAVVSEVVPHVFQRSVAILRPKPKLISSEFLYHLTQSIAFKTKIDKFTNKSAQAGIYLGKLKEIDFNLPPLAEQQRIAALLDTADRILKQRESAIAKIDQLASTTFDEMYDELDSVSTKSLGVILELQRGASPRPISDWMTEDVDGVNWIKIADATASDKYIYKCKERIKKEAVAMTRYVKSGDFLLSNSMSFGRPYILKTDGCIHDGWLLLRDTKNIFEQDYLYAVLSCRSVKEQFKKLATGAVVKNLNIDAVSKVKVKIPSQDIQKIFSKKMRELESNKANHVKQLGVIKKLLVSLQQQSFAVN